MSRVFGARFRFRLCRLLVVTVIVGLNSVHATPQDAVVALPSELHCRILGADFEQHPAHVEVLFYSESTETPTLPQAPAKPVRTLSLRVRGDGQYKIMVPADLRELADLQIAISVHHEQLLDRSVGAVPLADFAQRAQEGEARGLFRELQKQAILSTRLRKGQWIEGVVRQPDGRPAVRAVVTVASKYRPYSWKFHSPDDYGFSSTVQTDKQGRFRIQADTATSMTIVHAGFAPLLIDDFAKRVPMLGEDARTFSLSTGTRLEGRVLDAAGTPIPYAIVVAQRHFAWNEFDMPLSMARQIAADEEGFFQLPPLPAGSFKLTTASVLRNADEAAAFNRNVTTDRRAADPKLPAQRLQPSPLAAIVIPQIVETDGQTLTKRVDLQAVPTATVRVKVQFPDAPPDPDRSPDVGIAGKLAGSAWQGQYASAGADGFATLVAPVGLSEVKIKTGVAQFQRSADAEVELGQAIHLIKLGKDLDGFTVIKRQFGTIDVKLNVEPSLLAGGRIFFRAQYVRPGYSEHSPDKQTMSLHGATQSGRTKFRASAIPGEPFVLQVRKSIGDEEVILHEQTMSLKPGEAKELQLDIP